jgi:hypothetical protein
VALGTVSSNLYTSNQQQQSVYPGTSKTVCGYFTIPANTSFATTDILKMMQFPGPTTFFDSFIIDLPALDGGNGLTWKMVDTLASPTTFFTGNTTGQAAGYISTTNATNGTMGAATNANAGYSSGIELRLVPSHASTNTTGASALQISFTIKYFNL